MYVTLTECLTHFRTWASFIGNKWLPVPLSNEKVCSQNKTFPNTKSGMNRYQTLKYPDCRYKIIDEERYDGSRHSRALDPGLVWSHLGSGANERRKTQKRIVYAMGSHLNRMNYRLPWETSRRQNEPLVELRNIHSPELLAVRYIASLDLNVASLRVKTPKMWWSGR